MNSALLIILEAAVPVVIAVVVAVAITVVVAVIVAAVVLVSVSGRRRLQAQLDAARADVDALLARVDELSLGLAPDDPGGAPAEYVITDLADGPEDRSRIEPGSRRGGALSVPDPVPATLSGVEFASVALGESLVRVLSLGYGVRRALSAENRNRIRFEVRREVRRSRRQRRRGGRSAGRSAGPSAGRSTGRAPQERADPAEEAA